MALAALTFQSQCLRRPVQVTVLLPDGQTPRAVLYLLPGYSDGHASFVRNTALERYCAGLPLAVVMPDGENGFYTDAIHGDAQWSYVSRELPQLLERWLRLEGCRQYAGGISMGGYGAAKLALRQPERFQQVFLLSPVADIGKVAEEGLDTAKGPVNPAFENLSLTNIFGPVSPRGTQEDLYRLLADAPAASLPPVCIYTGTEDFMYEDIVALAQSFRKKGVPCELTTAPGWHSWAVWEAFLADLVARIGAQLA